MSRKPTAHSGPMLPAWPGAQAISAQNGVCRGVPSPCSVRTANHPTKPAGHGDRWCFSALEKAKGRRLKHEWQANPGWWLRGVKFPTRQQGLPVVRNECEGVFAAAVLCLSGIRMHLPSCFGSVGGPVALGLECNAGVPPHQRLGSNSVIGHYPVLTSASPSACYPQQVRLAWLRGPVEVQARASTLCLLERTCRLPYVGGGAASAGGIARVGHELQ
jgi:hypothetical protein